MTTEQFERQVDVDEQPGPTQLEREGLDFERSWWKHAGAKESAIRERFDFSSVRYYQLLNAVIDKPKALEHDPLLVRRLQRLRDARPAHRSARRSRRLARDQSMIGDGPATVDPTGIFTDSRDLLPPRRASSCGLASSHATHQQDRLK